VHTGARTCGLTPDGQGYQTSVPERTRAVRLGWGQTGDHKLSLLSDLAWWIRVTWWIRGSIVHRIHHVTPFHHVIFRALATKAPLRDA